MEDYKIVNTEKIQLQSLKNYMQSLKNYMQEIGYSYFNVDKVFYSPF